MAAEKGIDVSHYQGNINWTAVRNSGVTYAIGKTTEALTADPTWKTNRANALAAGVKIGGYHWAHPNYDPVQSAKAFAAAQNWVPGMLPAFIDVEHNGNPTSNPTAAGGVSATAIHNWVHAFAAAYGKPIGIYTGGWFWNDYVAPAAGNCAKCAAMPLWLSRYASTIGAIPKPWTKAAIWQYTESGSNAGIAGAVDLDQFVGSESVASLLSFAGGTTSTEKPEGDDMPLNSADLASIEHLIESHNASLEVKIKNDVAAQLVSAREGYARRTTSVVRANGLVSVQQHLNSNSVFQTDHLNANAAKLDAANAAIASLQADVDSLATALKTAVAAIQAAAPKAGA